MPPPTLLLATHNPGKVAEFSALLADLPLGLTSLEAAGVDEAVEETGETFAENAMLKAQAYAAATGLWAWADDSGLEVDLLDGRPGVYSARYGGIQGGGVDGDRARLQHLLAELQQQAAATGCQPPWTARFRCVVAVALPTGQVHSRQGMVEGMIIEQPRGSGGFGYDPIFWLPELGATMAELPPAEKHRISHRGQAARAARALLAQLLADR